jgi:hypothetical protein
MKKLLAFTAQKFYFLPWDMLCLLAVFTFVGIIKTKLLFRCTHRPAFGRMNTSIVYSILKQLHVKVSVFKQPMITIAMSERDSDFRFQWTFNLFFYFMYVNKYNMQHFKYCFIVSDMHTYISDLFCHSAM